MIIFGSIFFSLESLVG